MDSQRVLVRILVVALAASVWLVRAWLDAVLIAVVVALLAWPLHERIALALGRRRRLGTALTLGGLTLGLFLPLGLLGLIVGREVVILANEVAMKVQLGHWDGYVSELLRSGPLRQIVEAAGGRSEITEQLEGSARDGVLTLATTVTRNVPGLLSVTATVVIKVVVFLLALTTFLHRGPETVAWLRRLSPLSELHTDRLFAVFGEFARNVVLAGLVAGIAQGLVATLGFWLAGVDRVLLFGVLTAVFAYVPLVGTTLVWLPVSVLLLAEERAGAAAFVAVWSLALTGTVDNVIRPVVVRGRSDVPLLLVFLGAFGGLGSFGIVGLLVGPVFVAVVLALLRIYSEGLPERVADAPSATVADPSSG